MPGRLAHGAPPNDSPFAVAAKHLPGFKLLALTAGDSQQMPLDGAFLCQSSDKEGIAIEKVLRISLKKLACSKQPLAMLHSPARLPEALDI